MLACFTDQDARVRYYACEAMYNIAKVAKGEILIYFNHIFDALCKVPLPTLPLDCFFFFFRIAYAPASTLAGCRFGAVGQEWR